MVQLSRSFHFKLKIHVAVLQPQRRRNDIGLGYSPFDRHYLGNHYCFIFLRVLRCFSSPGSPPDKSGSPAFSKRGCPIRIPADVMDICSSPQLFAACHVLLRLWEPRHSPYALSNFLKYYSISNLVCVHHVKELNSRYESLVFCDLTHSSPLKSHFLKPVENIGVEPMTSCVQGRRSSQLS